MRQRTLGRTGLSVSEIGFGCGNGAGLMISDDVDGQRAAVERALERGVTYFDTAPIYGAFRSELALGRALRSLGATPRVATKVALELDDLENIAAAVVASVEGSLERLCRDELDVVYLHNRVGTSRAVRGDLGVGALLTIEDVLGPNGVVEGFESLRKRGLVQAFGCCAYGGDSAELARVIDSDFFDAMLVHYSVLNQTAFAPSPSGSTIRDYGGVAARAAKRGMGIANLRVLEAGLLASNSREQPSDTRERNAEHSHALTFLRDGDSSLASAAIRFALSNPAVSTVLIGVSEIAHVDHAIDASERGPLPPATLARIEAVRMADYVA
jgi:aryl-alcohol dehydrogenase-like predicted oxidoreductase